MTERKLQIRKEANKFISTKVGKWVPAVEVMIEEPGVYNVDADFSYVNSEIRLVLHREPYTSILGSITEDGDDFPRNAKEQELEVGDVIRLEFRIRDASSEVLTAVLKLETTIEEGA